jgi:hypothetical protein
MIRHLSEWATARAARATSGGSAGGSACVSRAACRFESGTGGSSSSFSEPPSLVDLQTHHGSADALPSLSPYRVCSLVHKWLHAARPPFPLSSRQIMLLPAAAAAVRRQRYLRRITGAVARRLNVTCAWRDRARWTVPPLTAPIPSDDHASACSRPRARSWLVPPGLYAG